MGARKPDGGAAKTERVTFTRSAAERIAKVVRRIESGDRDFTGPKYLARNGGGSSGKTFRICTFTGSWSKTAANTVTFRSQTTTPNTVVATNLFATIADAAGSRSCAIAKEGTAWFLIAAECD